MVYIYLFFSGVMTYSVVRLLSHARFVHLLTKVVLFVCFLGVCMQWCMGLMVGAAIRRSLQGSTTTRKDKFNIHIGYVRYVCTVYMYVCMYVSSHIYIHT